MIKTEDYLVMLALTFAIVMQSSSAALCSAVDLQAQAFDYLKANNYSKALEYFTSALKEHPDSWMLMQNIGNCQMELGHYDAAIAEFTKSIEIGGLHSSQCFNLAAVHQRLGQPKQALKWLKLGCSLDPAKAADPSIQAVINKLRDPANNPDGSPTAPDYLSGLDSFKGWSKQAMPLKVYVRRNYQIPTFYPEFIEIVRNSLDQWCRATDNAIAYKFVDDRESANLICDYTDRRELVSSQHELGIDGNTEMLVKQDGTPGKANIVILIMDAPGAPTFKMRAVLTQCFLHEAGHALGMHGHSPNIHDVMFSCVTLAGAATLSERDKNTIRRIYQP